MSVRRLSPTANLLRTSRLFALPPPLPRPVSELTGTVPDSDTATLPYPTHAAIETSDSAFQKGEWGLKRSLPLKATTRSSTRHIQIENVDSLDHITDFGSTSAYTKTLEKWQEMDLSLSKAGRNTREPPRSVFESDYDTTDVRKRTLDEERWKFEGPWLKGQTLGEFTGFVEKSVKRRRSEFRRFLRKECARKKLNYLRIKQIEQGAGEGDFKSPDPVSDDELEYFIGQLRRAPSELFRYVQDFLDLPREPPQKATISHLDISDTGPPLTHPSAGLSYLRSHSHTFNHPQYGPQEHKPPFEARVLASGIDARGYKQHYSVFGIGGVTAQHFTDNLFANRKAAEAAPDPDIKGGSKTWLQVNKAGVDPQGRIELGIKKAETSSQLAKDIDIMSKKTEFAAQSSQTTTRLDSPSGRPSNQNKQTYGLDFGHVRKKEEVQPMEEGDEIMPILYETMQGTSRVS
ncbi:uncharacterized protein KY384_003187 [Bacidia gigantensis]|uniref:uncharacterized protein n=1 Tax=Bacidia gigantensis TaxID=2732470 RepID=UPI001D04EC70|nr:uncharacterized protein KY384_003187 [Bacidia gigantensis]KAG8531557.1 hypothetical protein KY384_003187 [Bacidia gigantensis]